MSLAELPLVEFIGAVSPEFQPPWHLSEWCEMIEGCLKGGVRGLCAVPIRHHKTWTTLHGIAWLLLRDPTMRIIVMCADHERATELGKAIRRLCQSVEEQTGSKIGPARGDNLIHDWKNESDGGVVVMGVEQSKLGRDVDVLIVDDALTEKSCNDPLVRDTVDRAMVHYAMRAGRPGRRGSVLVVMSRWNDDDPIGRRIMRKAVEWRYVHHEALVHLDGVCEHKPTCEDCTERAFAPDVMTLEEIKARREEYRETDPSERLFWAQFQNDPKAQVDARFREPLRYHSPPEYPGFRYGIGVDLAYTPGEGDWFACVVVKFYGSVGYVADVVRERADFNTLENLIRARWDRYGRCPIYSYIAGPEKGAVQYFTGRGIPIQGLKARYNKATRAQKTIDRWNDGKIQLPHEGVWVSGFLVRVKAFTGSDKARDDDEIDALVSVCDGMLGTDASQMPRAFGQPRI